MTQPIDAAIYAVVKRYADAWATGDLRTIIDCYHDNVIFHYFGKSPLTGTHRGKSACLEGLKKVHELTNRKLISIKDVMVGQCYGIVVAVETFERNGVSIENRTPTEIPSPRRQADRVLGLRRRSTTY